MAASVLLAPFFDGPTGRFTVAHRSRLALQIVGPDDRVAFCVMFPGAVRLPYACAVASPVSASSPLSVGDGVLTWGDDEAAQSFAVTRWWRPARPRHPSLAAAVSTSGLRELRSWRDQIGRGPGLTPYADDVLCGALVALSAAGHPAFAELAPDIASSDLESRTTATSASLLRAACEGWCIDELADHLAALVGSGRSGIPAGRATRAALSEVGSSSGRGLLAGVSLVLPDIAGEEAA